MPVGATSAAVEVRRARRSAPREDRSTRWFVFAVVGAATLARGVGTFLYDASYYWDAALALVAGQGAPESDGNYYALRGVWTSVTYAPAAVLGNIGGETVAGVAVLFQNALFLAAVAAFLVPAVLRPWYPSLGRPARWAAGGLVWLTLQGFAPYPLVDVYAAAAVLLAVALCARGDVRCLLGAGLLLGYAVNLRPAYVPAAVLLIVFAVVTSRLRAAAVAGGMVAALVPQLVYNLATTGAFSIAPRTTGRLVELQAGYAAYTVRYDTYAWQMETSARQFFCAPGMAQSVGDLPTSTGELLRTFVVNLPGSALFALEKAAAALHWPVATPYSTHSPGTNALFAVAVTLITVVGCAFLICTPFLRRAGEAPGAARAGIRVAAVVVSGVVMLVGSATESRFAVVLVLVGVIGVTGLVEALPVRLSRHRWLVGVTAALALATIGLGYAGLAHPAPPGDVTPEICAGL